MADIMAYGSTWSIHSMSGPITIVSSMFLNIVAKKMLIPDVTTIIIGISRNIDV